MALPKKKLLLVLPAVLAVLLVALLSVAALRPGVLPLERLHAPAPPSPSSPAPTGAVPDEGALVSRVEREGLSLSLELRPTDGAKGERGHAVATLTLTDARSGEPVSGLRPRAWMSLREGDAAPTDAECREHIKKYLGGLLSVRPEVDLNAWFLIAMNHDNTLSVINPQLSFSRTQLRALVTLAGPAADWALLPDRSALFVSVPSAGHVSVVDTQRFLATTNIPVGERPGRLALSPDGRTLWVGHEGAGTVTVVDTQARGVRGTLKVGAGPHAFAFADEGRTAWVAGTGADTVRVFDTVTLQEVAGLEVGEGAVSLAPSALARAVLVANGRTGEVVVASAQGAKALRRVRLQPGLSGLSVDPSGRWAFVLHRARGEVTVLDVSSPDASPRVLTGFAAPDSMAFSPAFAYVRNAGSAKLTLVRLESLTGTPTVVDVQVGQRPATEARRAALAGPLAPTPDGNGMMVASPADQSFAFYVEGMMAPMGTLKAYGREPRAALVLDRSLAEVQPGVYRTTVQLGDAGTYDAAVLVDSPRVATCLPVEVDAAHAGPAHALAHRVELTPGFDPAARLTAGQEHRLRFHLKDGASSAPVRAAEVSVLLFRPPGSWRWHGELVEAGDGHFELAFTPPAPGTYSLLVGVPSRGAAPGSLRPLSLRVQPARSTPSRLQAEVRP